MSAYLFNITQFLYLKLSRHCLLFYFNLLGLGKGCTQIRRLVDFFHISGKISRILAIFGWGI